MADVNHQEFAAHYLVDAANPDPCGTRLQRREHLEAMFVPASPEVSVSKPANAFKGDHAEFTMECHTGFGYYSKDWSPALGLADSEVAQVFGASPIPTAQGVTAKNEEETIRSDTDSVSESLSTDTSWLISGSKSVTGTEESGESP